MCKYTGVQALADNEHMYCHLLQLVPEAHCKPTYFLVATVTPTTNRLLGHLVLNFSFPISYTRAHSPNQAQEASRHWMPSPRAFAGGYPTAKATAFNTLYNE